MCAGAHEGQKKRVRSPGIGVTGHRESPEMGPRSSGRTTHALNH